MKVKDYNLNLSILLRNYKKYHFGFLWPSLTIFVFFIIHTPYKKIHDNEMLMELLFKQYHLSLLYFYKLNKNAPLVKNGVNHKEMPTALKPISLLVADLIENNKNVLIEEYYLDDKNRLNKEQWFFRFSGEYYKLIGLIQYLVNIEQLVKIEKVNFIKQNNKILLSFQLIRYHQLKIDIS